MKTRLLPITWIASLCVMSAHANDGQAYKSQLDTPVTRITERGEDEYRVLFIGDSITRHGTNASVKEKLGWGHIAGMAASTESNDYAHRFVDKLKRDRPNLEITHTYHTAGGSGSVKQRLDAFDAVQYVDPDLVVIQLGEHEKETDGTEALRQNLASLIARINAFPREPVIICIGPWAPTMNGASSPYNGWDGEVDATMRGVCNQEGVPYISVRELAEDSANHGWGEHPGVRWHPNDAGHAGYARLLYETYTTSF